MRQPARLKLKLATENGPSGCAFRDDGKGIPSELLEAGRPGHYGLSGMRERAQQIGAKLEIWSGTKAGTEIELSIAGSIAYRTADRQASLSFVPEESRLTYDSSAVCR